MSPKSRISFSLFFVWFVLVGFWYMCFSLSMTVPRYVFWCFTCLVVLSL